MRKGEHREARQRRCPRAPPLQDEVTKANSINPAQRQAFDRLVADVKAYNASTQRFDVSIERATFVTPGKQQRSIQRHSLRELLQR